MPVAWMGFIVRLYVRTEGGHRDPGEENLPPPTGLPWGYPGCEQGGGGVPHGCIWPWRCTNALTYAKTM